MATLPFVEMVRPVETNIVIFDLKKGLTADAFLATMKTKNILGVAFGPQTVRFVTHLDYSDQMHSQVLEVLNHVSF